MPLPTLGLKLPDPVLSSLTKSGIEKLFPIQLATLAELRSGVDVVARAQTGSGKTLAFLIPIMERLADPARKRTHKHPVVLIIGEKTLNFFIFFFFF
jgi:ATP-dependent RNA helicase DDX21